MIATNAIPFQTLNDKFFFNKQQIVEWALIRNLPINITNHSNMSEYQVKALNTILDQGAFYYDCALTEASYLEQMLSLIPLDANIDKGIIIQLLKNREALMSTAIGNGISPVSYTHLTLPTIYSV